MASKRNQTSASGSLNNRSQLNRDCVPGRDVDHCTEISGEGFDHAGSSFLNFLDDVGENDLLLPATNRGTAVRTSEPTLRPSFSSPNSRLHPIGFPPIPRPPRSATSGSARGSRARVDGSAGRQRGYASVSLPENAPPVGVLEQILMRNRSHNSSSPRTLPVERDSMLYQMLARNGSGSQSDLAYHQPSPLNEPPLLIVPQRRSAPVDHDSRGQNFDFPTPSPHTSVNFWDLMVLPGPGADNQVQTPQVIGPVVSYSRNDAAEPGAPSASQAAPAQTNEEHRSSSELQHGLYSALLESFANLAQRILDMLNRVTLQDDMSYVGMFQLEERNGGMGSGLDEKEIMEHLYLRNYVCCVTAPAENCCICLGEFAGADEIGGLDCGHEFHSDCIKKWLRCKNRCPVCKAEA